MLSINERKDLLVKMNMVGLHVDQKQLHEFGEYGTVVVKADQNIKNKIDRVIDISNYDVEISEFSDDSIIITDGSLILDLTVLERAKEFQNS
jgi:hypothetical protein